MKYVELENKIVVVESQEQPWMPDLSSIGRESINVTSIEVLPLTGWVYDGETFSPAVDERTYAEKRKAKYDALSQFEMQYDDAKNSTTTWVDAIDVIKAEFPKA